MLFSSVLRLVLPVTCAAVLFTGCGETIEKNKLFKDQQKIVARLDDDTKAISRHLEDLSVTVSTMMQDVREIKNSPASGRLTGDLETHLKEIQDALSQTTTRLSALEKQSKNSAKAGATDVSHVASAAPKEAAPKAAAAKAAAAKEEAATDEAAEPRTPATRVANENDGGGAGNTKATAGPRKTAQIKITRASNTTIEKPAKASKPARATGGYYTVKSGDTADAIAASHNISMGALMSANGIPKGKNAKFQSGQRIFIPSSR